MRALVALLAGAVLLGACSGGEERTAPPADEPRTAEEPRISSTRLPSLVLQPGDVPPAFVRFDEGEIGFTDLQPGPRGDERRFGREGGWKARYKRSGPAEASGPLVVVSFADVFDSSDGAKRDLAAYERDYTDRGWSSVEAEPLGDESVALTLVQGSGPTALRYHALAWRTGNVTASVQVSGFDRKVSLDDALELARAQQRRIERAA